MTVHEDSYELTERYSQFEEQFDPLQHDRQARRARRPKPRHVPKKPHGELIHELAEEVYELEGGFNPTYQPSKHEAAWLLDSLRGFYQAALISDVEALVKGGKEASVYRCTAHPSTGQRWLAAKVYRPRMFRSLSNDAMYREGRDVLTEEGRPVKKNDHRVMRALGKKTAFGEQVSHTSWLMHEFNMLDVLRASGAAVPLPYGVGENAILMSYIGDDRMAAPTLIEVTLDPAEAPALFASILQALEQMLAHGFVHGDLSAYNVLYWEGRVTVIDFPQVIDIQHNRSARFALRRDLTRLCDYFSRCGVQADPRALLADLWDRYGPRIPEWVE